jgi:hypothetical protein
MAVLMYHLCRMFDLSHFVHKTNTTRMPVCRNKGEQVIAGTIGTVKLITPEKRVKMAETYNSAQDVDP